MFCASLGGEGTSCEGRDPCLGALLHRIEVHAPVAQQAREVFSELVAIVGRLEERLVGVAGLSPTRPMHEERLEP